MQFDIGNVGVDIDIGTPFINCVRIMPCIHLISRGIFSTEAWQWAICVYVDGCSCSRTA